MFRRDMYQQKIIASSFPRSMASKIHALDHCTSLNLICISALAFLSASVLYVAIIEVPSTKNLERSWPKTSSAADLRC